MNWIEKIIPTIGLLIGIVFVAIGAILAGGAALKLGFYTPQPTSSFSYQCEFAIGSDTARPESRLTDSERSTCLVQAQADEAIRYKTDKKNTVIDGSMFLVVGAAFWILFKRWRKKA